MNPDDSRKIDELKAQIADIERNGARNDLIHAVKKNVDDNTLYASAKGFTNFVEKAQRQANLVKARDARLNPAPVQ